MKRSFALVAVVLLLALPLVAQEEPCADLEITVVEDEVTISVTGATPDSATFLASGETEGETVIDLGELGSLTVDLDRPFATLPLGETDENGDLSVTVTVPPLGATLFNQSLTLDVTLEVPPPQDENPLTVDSCTSDVVEVTL